MNAENLIPVAKLYCRFFRWRGRAIEIYYPLLFYRGKFIADVILAYNTTRNIDFQRIRLIPRVLIEIGRSANSR